MTTPTIYDFRRVYQKPSQPYQDGDITLNRYRPVYWLLDERTQRVQPIDGTYEGSKAQQALQCLEGGVSAAYLYWSGEYQRRVDERHAHGRTCVHCGDDLTHKPGYAISNGRVKCIQGTACYETHKPRAFVC